ncbi:hypothetical protein ACJJTC_013077 [Scirpophaga incertulas]
MLKKASLKVVDQTMAYALDNDLGIKIAHHKESNVEYRLNKQESIKIPANSNRCLRKHSSSDFCTGRNKYLREPNIAVGNSGDILEFQASVAQKVLAILNGRQLLGTHECLEYTGNRSSGQLVFRR